MITCWIHRLKNLHKAAKRAHAVQLHTTDTPPPTLSPMHPHTTTIVIAQQTCSHSHVPFTLAIWPTSNPFTCNLALLTKKKKKDKYYSIQPVHHIHHPPSLLNVPSDLAVHFTQSQLSSFVSQFPICTQASAHSRQRKEKVEYHTIWPTAPPSLFVTRGPAVHLTMLIATTHHYGSATRCNAMLALTPWTTAMAQQ